MSKDLFNIWMNVFVPICLEADEHDFLYYPVKQDVHDVYSHEIRSIWKKYIYAQVKLYRFQNIEDSFSCFSLF